MGVSTDYPNVPEWVSKSEGYQTGAMVKYKGNIFSANFWASEPGVGDAEKNGWRFYDELYDQTPHTPTQQAKIIAYIPTWRKEEGFNYANDEMYQYITHGIIAFLMFSEINLGEFDPNSVNDVYATLSDVVNTGHRNGTRISIALGGASDYGFLNLMTSIGNNPANPLLDRAVQNVVNFVNSNNLDGVDLDLECWWGKPGEKEQAGRPKSEGPHPAGYALTLFAQKLKQAMPDKLVSAAIFGTSWFGNNYDPKIADYVDWLGVMTYDLTGSWNQAPVGPHTALFKIRNQESSKIRNQEFYQESFIQEQQGEWPGGGLVNNPILSVEDTLWYWTNPLFVNWQGAGHKIPRNKIAAGVPIYGYDFAYGKDPDDLSGQVPPGYKSIRYKDILAQFPDAHTAANANIKVSGSTPRPPFISASGDYPYTHNIYFETPETAVTKLNFLKDVGVQGVIIWELSNDVWEEGKSIIKALYRNSGNSASRTSITGLQIRTGLQIAGGILGTKSQARIVNTKNGMAITAKGKGEQVYQDILDTNNPLQAFNLVPTGDPFASIAGKVYEVVKIQCVANSLFLSVSQNSEADQAPMILWDGMDESGQKFVIVPESEGSEARSIHPTRLSDRGKDVPRFYLSVTGDSTERNAGIVQIAPIAEPGVITSIALLKKHQAQWKIVSEVIATALPWIEARGANSYCHCRCNNTTYKYQMGVSDSHTMNIEAGAPYFYAVLTKDDDTVDFPTGAILTIQGPDGTKYDRDIQEENQLVIMSGSSIRCLIVKDPKPGYWTMTMTVPKGVGFHCECNTVPSKDPYKTITNALSTSNRLQTRDLSKKDNSLGWYGLASIAKITAAAVTGSAAAGLPGLVIALAGGVAVNLLTSLAHLDQNAYSPVNNTATSLRDGAAANSQQPISVNSMRIATWNVYHGNLQAGIDPYGNQRPASTTEDRVRELVNYGYQNNIDLIAFQEIPQSILNNPNHHVFTTTIANTNYHYVIVNSEYPPRPNINAPAPASATTDGYLILYNPAVFNLLNNAAGTQWEFFQPQSFLQGLSQARPPVRLQFQMTTTDTLFNFLTWHTEPQQHFASNYVQTAYNLLTQQGGNWIIAGDLNIRDNIIPQALRNQHHHLTHDDQTLDHIITSGTVVNLAPNLGQNQMVTGPNDVPVNPIAETDPQWGRFWSDAHYVLFGIVWF
jgi:GH18 family chitinase